MKPEIKTNNKVLLEGTVSKTVEFDHEYKGEEFYLFIVDTKRNSGVVDSIPVEIKKSLMNGVNLNIGKRVLVTGQYRSVNKIEGDKHRLILRVFAEELKQSEGIVNDTNNVWLNGYICRKPEFRITPKGREICDIMFAVNRAYHKSDYIPCIAWREDAKNMKDMLVGTELMLNGRIQSRKYNKTLPDGQVVEKTAYEFSISRIDEQDDLKDVFEDLEGIDDND